jgi:predicted metalloendopeptidase
MALETKLADASLDNVTLRDPSAVDHKTTFDALATLAPHVDWASYFSGAHLPTSDLNVMEPKFLSAVDRELTATPMKDWKIYLKAQLLESAADSLSAPFVNESFLFTSFLTGAKSPSRAGNSAWSRRINCSARRSAGSTSRSISRRPRRHACRSSCTTSCSPCTTS